MGKKAKGGLNASLKELSQLAQKAKNRFDKSIQKAMQGNYGGADIVSDMFEQWQDLWNVWTNVGTSGGVQIAYIYLPAGGGQSQWDSADLSFDEPLGTQAIANLVITNLLGPVVNNVQDSIPKAQVEIVPRAQGQNAKSIDFFVRVKQAPTNVGPYRGLIIDGSNLIAEIHVYAH